MMQGNNRVIQSWRLSDWIFAAFLTLFAILAVILVFVFVKYAYSNPEEAANLGTTGDFIGGFLNPILTSLTFIGILLSIFLQRLELSHSRKELERSADALEEQLTSIRLQNFEASFFQMLNSFNSLVSSIDLHNHKTSVTTQGRDCFKVFYTRLNKIYREQKKRAGNKYSEEEVLYLSYSLFWKEHQLELGHYFRFLYNIFKFLEENSISKSYHSKLVRAQLSDQELLLLFYNCTSRDGNDFVKYAVIYELFDNLPTVRLLDKGHIDFVDKKSFGGNPMYNGSNIPLSKSAIGKQ